MKIIRFIQGGELTQLGIDKKVLYLKWGNQMLKPMRLGELKEIKSLSLQKDITLNNKEIKVPLILKQMAKSITPSGIELANKLTNEGFYQDILKDHKEMSEEGSLNFIGEFTEWD